MKRVLLSFLAFLLIVSSIGQVFAAALCARPLAGECCLTGSALHKHNSVTPPHHIKSNIARHSMAIEGMAMGEVAGNDSATGATAVEAIPPCHEAMDEDGVAAKQDSVVSATPITATRASAAAPSRDVHAVRMYRPLAECRHCLSHSRTAPLFTLCVPNQSNKDQGAALSPIPEIPIRPRLTVVQRRLRSEQTPPGLGTRRYLLINVLLI
jgi:hypothetical protein